MKRNAQAAKVSIPGRSSVAESSSNGATLSVTDAQAQLLLITSELQGEPVVARHAPLHVLYGCLHACALIKT